MRVVTMVLSGVGTLVGAGLIAIPTVLSLPQGPKRDALMGNNFYAIRQEALALFPRGSRLTDTADGLIGIGFRCQGIPHKVANVNAASLLCDSHGRGYPTSPALNITVLGRNGLVSDFEVWNIVQQADANTPPPAAVPVQEAAAAEETHGKPEAKPSKSH